MSLRYLSLFSGIEAATVAWHPLGWTPVAFAEIEPFPSSVLAAHYPNVPNLGDVTQITDEQIAALGPIDVVIGGSPCQDLSVAGKRAGLAGARSSLFHEQVRIFHAARHFCGCRWLVWENVPGAFSSHGGRDFAVVVGTLAGCTVTTPRNGWGTEGAAVGENGLVEWCVLDAQWFGVAQRRERVFAVLDTGNWQDRPPVLLEPESVRGDHPPGRESGQGVAPCISARTKGGGGLGTDFDCDGGLIHDVAHALRADGFDASEDGTGRGTPIVPTTVGALTDGAHNGGGLNGQDAYSGRIFPVAFDTAQITSKANRTRVEPGLPASTLNQAGMMHVAFGWQNSSRQGASASASVTPTLDKSKVPGISSGMQVRRLTPRECERLQGFPDDYTLVTHRCKPAADGPRYKALGNSMAVPVIQWIGLRIQRAHEWRAAA